MGKGRFLRKARAERRHRTKSKLLQRAEMMRRFGKQGGTIYEKHRQKIERSLGYMRNGNVRHFVSVGFSKKTRDRTRYGPPVIRTRHDERSVQDAAQQIREIYI